MANIWLIEGSQVVQRMVEIALDGLPAKLSFTKHVSNLIEDDAPNPHLVICAEYILDAQDTSYANSYLGQIEYLVQQGYQCPVVILQNQATSKIEPYLLADGLPLVASVRKPFKSFDLLKVICSALALKIPYEEVYSAQSRVIPLARPKVPMATPPSIPITAAQPAPMATDRPSITPEIIAPSTAIEDATTQLTMDKSLTPAVAAEGSAPPILAEASTPPVLAEALTPPVLAEASTPPVLAEASTPPVLAEASTLPIMGEGSDPAIMDDATTPPSVIESPILPNIPEPPAPPVLSVPESNPVSQSLEPTDLSPPPRYKQHEEADSAVKDEPIEDSELAQPPSAEDSFHFDFNNLDETPDHSLSAYEAKESSSSSLPDELQDDWLDESGATVNMAALPAADDDELNSAQSLEEQQSLDEEQSIAAFTDSSEPLSSTINESLSPSNASNHLESYWLQELKVSVETISDQALRVVQKAIHSSPTVKSEPQHTLSNHEMRVLIERIAWEVVPSLASVELRDRIQQMSNK